MYYKEANMNSINVDIDELIDKLNAMVEDGFVTVKLTIVEDDYISELRVDAVGIDDEDSLGYGSVNEVLSDF